MIDCCMTIAELIASVVVIFLQNVYTNGGASESYP